MDKLAKIALMSRRDVVASLRQEDVKRFLISLGVQNIEEKNGVLICPTICHNPIEEPGSMKLYWYQNKKIFHCYTECNDSMSIFDLYKKFMRINFSEVSEEQATLYVKRFLMDAPVECLVSNSSYNDDENEYEMYHPTELLVRLDEYPAHLAHDFTHYYHPAWLAEGISKEAMDRYDISFCVGQNKIVIPHYDVDGRLVGLRGRAFEEEDLENGRKYMPFFFGNQIYSHPLHFNLYGAYQNKDAIRTLHCAVLFEGEKSVLKGYDMYGKYNMFLAVCGSNLNKFQVNILLLQLGVNEIVIAFDKEYDDWDSPEGRKYEKKLRDICNKYKDLVSCSYIFDRKGLLDRKDSPVDKGKEVWEQLFQKRTRVR